MAKLKNHVFVSFRMKEDDFIAAVPLDAMKTSELTSEVKLRRVAKIYAKGIRQIRVLVTHLELTKSRKIPLAASQIWDLGDKILSLVEAINEQNFEIDNLYEHLIRDLGRKKDWLKKAIIFRRNLPKQQLIPTNLNWSFCKDSPRKSAELILKGDVPKRRAKK